MEAARDWGGTPKAERFVSRKSKGNTLEDAAEAGRHGIFLLTD
jgi:hypothetical protein